MNYEDYLENQSIEEVEDILIEFDECIDVTSDKQRIRLTDAGGVITDISTADFQYLLESYFYFKDKLKLCVASIDGKPINHLKETK